MIVFVEHEPTHAQMQLLLGELDGVRGQPILVLWHLRPGRSAALMDEVAAARGLGVRSAITEIRAEHDEELAAARRHLSHVVGVLRAGGHPTHGELFSGPMPRSLVREIRSRKATQVLVVTSNHRLSHLAHHDLEHHLRKVTRAEVTAVVSDRHPHLA